MQQKNKKKQNKYFGLFVLILFFSFSSCAGTQNNYTAVNSTADLSPESNDELVESPSLPLDDGIALTLAERIAFNSTGDFDQHLTPEQLQQVERHFKMYMHYSKKHFERYLQRAEGYLPYVKEVFREMGIPEELAYLAIVESGFNPNAVSRAKATGMWQFMRFTGKRFGLLQNAWIDERRDAYKSSVAAAHYLKMLHEFFGDWHFAIAAYNAGEGKIKRAIEHTGAESFFELCDLNSQIASYKTRLRLETQQYVPRLLAVAKIMRNLELLGFEPIDFEKVHQVARVEVGPGTDLGALAKNAGLSYQDFKALNPAYRSSISPPNTKSTAYVPKANNQRAVAWLSKPSSSQFAGWVSYKVKKGDSLYVLSKQYAVPITVLKQANNLSSNNLRQGANLIMPGTKARTTYVASRVQRSNSDSHLVKKGESLYSIAGAYGISIKSLQQANGMPSSHNIITVGQKLTIPKATRSAALNAGHRYVVQKGDTLYDLAIRNSTSIDAIANLNGLNKNRPIYPGQSIKLPSNQ